MRLGQHVDLTVIDQYVDYSTPTLYQLTYIVDENKFLYK